MQVQEEQGASAILPTEERMVQTPAEWLSYSQCRAILQPVMELEGENLTQSTMNNIAEAIKKAIATAGEVQYDLGDMEQVIIALVHDKFDNVTKSIWEFQTMAADPSLSVLNDFLRNRSTMVEREMQNQQQGVQRNQQSAVQPETHRKIYCTYCRVNSHTIFKCDHFNTLTIRAKTEFLQREGRCLNCLTIHGHNPCPSGPCRTCDQPHNSTLWKRNPKNMG